VVVLLQPHSSYDGAMIVAGSSQVLDTRGWLPTAPNVERL